VTCAADLQLGNNVIGRFVLGDQRINVGFVGGVNRFDQLVDSPGVDADAETDLDLGLVTLGDRDVAHVVAEAGETHFAGRGPATGGTGPGADLGGDGGVGDVPNNGLAGDAHSRLDVAELPVAVGGLVEVHKVEVDLAPGQFDVGLRVQVEEGLLQRVESADPHLRGAERVHPRDDADNLVLGVCLERQTANRVAVLEHGLPHHGHRHVTRCAKGGRDCLRLLGYLLEGLRTVEVLAAGEKPNLVGGEVGNDGTAHGVTPAVVGTDDAMVDDAMVGGADAAGCCPYTFW
jgi:hypothetical protein